MEANRTAKILENLYEGITDPQQWLAALSGVVEATDSAAASVVLWDRAADVAVVGDQIGLPADLVRDYAAHYHQLDPGRQFMDRVATGGWYCDERDFGASTMRKSPFYQDFLRAYQLDSTMASPFLRSGSIEGFLSLSASAGRRDLSATARSLEGLMPHIQRAAGLRLRLQALEQRTSLHDALISTVGFPLLALTANGKVVLANDAGQGWLQQAGCPLSARRPLADNIRRLLHSACGVTGPRRAAGLKLRGAGHFYYLTAVPLGERVAGGLGSEPTCLLLVTDPQTMTPNPNAVLRDLFKLTSAELRVLEPLLQGLVIKEICNELQISYETGRSHMRSIFQKLGVRRQVDVVRLLGRLSLFGHRDAS